MIRWYRSFSMSNSGADPAPDRGHDRLDLEVREHLVDAVLLRVDHLAAEGKDRLEVLVARVDRGASCRVALDEVELAALGVGRLAVGEPAGETAARECPLSRDLAGLAGRLTGAGGVDRLGDDLLALVRVLVEELGELLVDDLLHEAAYPRVAELRLRLALELRLADLQRDDGGEALADVVALEVHLLLLELSLVAGELVDRRGERGVEARPVRAALDRIDVVREREDGVGRVLRVPLHRDLDRAAALLVLRLEVGDRRVDRVLLGVDVTDEVANPALVVELLRPLAAALVGEADAEAARQERGLTQALPERVAGEVELLEDLGVGEERDRRARVALVGGAGDLELRHRVPARELLPVHLPVAAHLCHEPLGQGVDDRDADPVEAARDLVAVAAELATGVELREDDGQRREVLILDHVGRDAPSVVDDSDRVVGVEPHLDEVVMTCERLVDRVVDDLVDQVVEPP